MDNRNLYIAFTADLAERSEKVHGSYRGRYKKKDPSFQSAIERWIELTDRVKELIETGAVDGIAARLDENFDIRRTVQSISEGNLEMVETARRSGASAKFTGSGGAIIGTYDDESMFDQLKETLSLIGVDVIIPEITAKIG